MSINDAFKKGVKAYEDYNYGNLCNKPVNPYDKDSDDYNSWNLGWKSESESHDCSIRAEQHERHAGKFSSY